ncbi:MAG: Hsp20/alpha crystallin family protein [Victivallaceae bacterium]|jgi:HSP20 family molecular chaperone IbpA
MSDIVKKENKVEVRKAEVKRMEHIEFAPPSDVVENHTGIVVLLDVPGATTDKLSVNVEDRILKIEADTDLMQHGKHVRYKRSFQISHEIALEKISAKIKDGVLRLELPKAESAKVHKIKVATE